MIFPYREGRGKCYSGVVSPRSLHQEDLRDCRSSRRREDFRLINLEDCHRVGPEGPPIPFPAN